DVRPGTGHSNAPGGGPPSVAGSQMSGSSGVRAEQESGFFDGIGTALAGRHESAPGSSGAEEGPAGYVNLAELPLETEREEVVIGFTERVDREQLWAALPAAHGQAHAGADEVEEVGRWEKRAS